MPPAPAQNANGVITPAGTPELPNAAPAPPTAAAPLFNPPPYSGRAGAPSGVDVANNRPSLPVEHRNPHLNSLAQDVLLVKFQTIVRENRNIVVGRVKVPVPGASRHAFILRRYDTDAISLTTMFKVAFPGAPEAAEKREEEWVVSNFDTRGTNGGRDSPHVRLAGHWVSRNLAIHLSEAYNVKPLVEALARADPDPSVEYRMSQRSLAAVAQQAAAQGQGANAAAGPVPAEQAGAPAPKRQRGSVPSATQNENGTTTYTVEATTVITAPAGTEPHMEAEVAAAKRIVQDVTEQMRLRALAGHNVVSDGAAANGNAAEGSSTAASRKRTADETAEPVVLSAGAADLAASRVIRHNRRVETPAGTQAKTVKKVAWSVAVFGLGVAASTFASAYL